MIMVHDPLNAQTDPEGQAQGPASGEGERVAKALARAGVASRREVERLIEAGRVALNGKVLTTPAVKVEPNDILTVDGEVVDQAEPARLFRYHKPAGLVTSHNDPQGRPTVFDALPKGLPRLISVGRLDLNTEGLLLLTNDGELARALELPATALVRRYRARAHGRITQDRLDTLKTGVTVEGVRYGPIEATLDKAKEGPSGANLWITLTLAEGKNREVRRVLESLGLKVNRLLRLSYGPFALGTLDEGEVEEVGPRVIREQLAEHIEPGNLPQGDRPQWRSPTSAKSGQRRGAGAETSGPFGTQAPEAEAVRTKGKPVYKEGWAKPKPKTVHAEKPRKAKPQDPKAAKPYYPAKPPRAAKPGPATIGPHRDSGPPRDAALKRDAGGSRDAAAKRAHPPGRGAGPKRETAAPRDAAPKRDFAPKRDHPAKRDAAPTRDVAPKRDFTPKRDAAPQRDAAPKRAYAPKRDAASTRDGGPKRDAGPKREGGKSRPSGSPPEAGRPAGPRGRSPSASPPRSSGARPPAPRPGGGPGRRG